MDKKSLLISLAAILLSFAGGFLLANSINRREMNNLRGENERLKADNSNSDKNELSNDEIDAKIAEADKDPSNIQYQKNLGTALYQYAAMKQDAELLQKSIRLLERAASLDKNDRAILVSLGNAYFDVGYYSKKNEGFEKAREAYRRALEVKADDAEVRTDFGLTYFLHDPPDVDSAVMEFRKALEVDPRHIKTLQFLTQALVKQNKPGAAEEYLERLKKADPSDASIKELAALIQNAKQQSAPK
ncbi:MAG TPA: tetratricopeptide repeat protein [Pyrinomonadaceae bacterium]|nr:tetratricopeptide repeat protein [Pyrinomonadaceae bacterium]